MMKKILAAAIVSAFAAPAFAATANVDVYGNFSMSVDVLDDGVLSGTNVSNNASRLGFKGAEDLGGGLAAIWQAEFGLALDNRVPFNTSTRDTFVGLKSKNLGTVRLGFFDTPTKILSRKLDMFNNQIGDTRNFLRNNARTGLDGGAANTWEERFDNGIGYETPNFGGFSASAHYSTQIVAGGGFNHNATDAYSIGGDYANGPFYVGVAYQSISNPDSGLLPSTDDQTALRIGGGVKMGDITVNALWHKAEDQRFEAGRDRTVYGLGAGYKLGNGQIKAQYYRAADEKGLPVATANNGAKMFAVGYDYNLSKRTMVYAAYAKTKNDSAALFSAASGGGHGDGLAPAAAGRDPSAYSLGITHKF